MQLIPDRVLSDKDTTPSLITNFNAEYQMTENGSVFLTVNNILDREDISYRSSSTEYYYTPVNFLIGANAPPFYYEKFLQDFHYKVVK